jgi:aminoglycoside phosphotransferase (APT) family kinase protein
MADIYYTVAHRSQEEINSFKSRYDMFDVSCIVPIFKEFLQLTVTNIKPSTSWGSSHVIYFVLVKERKDTLVFRANLGFNKAPEAVMKVEQLVCAKVEKVGVPTNKVLYVDISRKKYSFDFQIEECLVGSDIENNFKGTKEEYDKMSFDLGKYIATYSKIQFDKFGMFDADAANNNLLQGTKNTFYDYIITCLEEDLTYLVNSNVVTDEKRKKIRKIFEEHKPIINSIKRGSLVHHDLADHNIFFDGKNAITGIFDWEAAVIGDPMLDLASCPTWRTFYPREEILIKGYTSITPLPEYFQEKMNIYRLRTMLWKIVYAIRMNILNDARKQKFYDSLLPFQLL